MIRKPATENKIIEKNNSEIFTWLCHAIFHCKQIPYSLDSPSSLKIFTKIALFVRCSAVFILPSIFQFLYSPNLYFYMCCHQDVSSGPAVSYEFIPVFFPFQYPPLSIALKFHLLDYLWIPALSLHLLHWLIRSIVSFAISSGNFVHPCVLHCLPTSFSCTSSTSYFWTQLG